MRRGDVAAFRLPVGSLQDLTAADEAKAASLARDPAIAADAGLAAEAAQFLPDGCDDSSRLVKMEVEGVLGRGLGL